MRIEGTDIFMTRGDTGSITVTVKNKAGKIVPLVDGDTLYLTVKESKATTVKALQKTVTAFQEDGRGVIPINPADTSGLKFGNYWYDIQLNKADGSVYTIVKHSRFIVEVEITYE